MSDNGKIKLKSVKKTFDVLNCFTEKQPLGVTEISEKLDLYKSNVHSILSTLLAMDYLEQDKESGKYYLGIGVVRLGRAVGDRYSFNNLVSIHMKQMAEAVGEIVYLTVPLRDMVYYLDTAFPDDGASYLVGSIRNATEKMHSTGSGKAMLAFMPDAYADEYMSKPLDALTEHTITDATALREELANIRKRGYATDNMETMIGISCVAAPIRNRVGSVLGALSISGPSPRFSDARVTELSAILLGHIEEIQKDIV